MGYPKLLLNYNAFMQKVNVAYFLIFILKMLQYLNMKPITFVIFGGTGDLAQNKIFSALFDLYAKHLLPSMVTIVGFSRKSLSDADYQKFVIDSLLKKRPSIDASLMKTFVENFRYVQGDINTTESYDNLGAYLKKTDERIGLCTNKLFYLAVPPHLYEPVFTHIDEANLVTPCDKHAEGTWTRVLVEKPFGSDPEGALRLDKLLGKLFDENQVFRIDHYLAKEALQNIIAFRFANPIFGPIWNRDLIDRVEINFLETNTVSERGNFYDPIGALRDVGQNHILQMLALIAMEDPQGITADKIRTARARVLADIVPASRTPDEFIRVAQYAGYTNEAGVKPDSTTETFFELKLNVANRRWKNVPFLITYGKALSKNLVQIKILFREEESCVCPVDDICHYGNTITINVQPEENISVSFWKKTPGLAFGLEEKTLSFKYESGMSMLSDAYEKVLYDCILGDQTLFTSTEEVALQWRLISKVMEAVKKVKLGVYERGSEVEKVKSLK